MKRGTKESHPLKVRLGEVLREERKAKGWSSQDDFADHIEMHRAYYGALERGEKNLQLDTLERVCNGLDLAISEAFRRAEAKA
jgi:transcriptional regulator with XRE-family HTH domain